MSQDSDAMHRLMKAVDVNTAVLSKIHLELEAARGVDNTAKPSGTDGVTVCWIHNIIRKPCQGCNVFECTARKAY